MKKLAILVVVGLTVVGVVSGVLHAAQKEDSDTGKKDSDLHCFFASGFKPMNGRAIQLGGAFVWMDEKGTMWWSNNATVKGEPCDEKKDRERLSYK